MNHVELKVYSVFRMEFLPFVKAVRCQGEELGTPIGFLCDKKSVNIILPVCVVNLVYTLTREIVL